jgi:hypothetical protein
MELALHVVARALRRRIEPVLFHELAAHGGAGQDHLYHEPFDREACHLDALAVQPPPDLPRSIDLEVLRS